MRAAVLPNFIQYRVNGTLHAVYCFVNVASFSYIVPGLPEKALQMLLGCSRSAPGLF